MKTTINLFPHNFAVHSDCPLEFSRVGRAANTRPLQKQQHRNRPIILHKENNTDRCPIKDPLQPQEDHYCHKKIRRNSTIVYRILLRKQATIRYNDTSCITEPITDTTPLGDCQPLLDCNPALVSHTASIKEILTATGGPEPTRTVNPPTTGASITATATTKDPYSHHQGSRLQQAMQPQ